MKRISANQANDEKFFQIPKSLQNDEFYKPMSVYAKYLYGVLKDRFKLSLKNNWVDQNGYIYIYCTVKDIQDILGIGKTKATQVKHELQQYDLLEEVQQGINKPNRIYVGQVVFHRVETSEDADVQNMNSRTTEIRTPGRPEYERQDDRNMNGNNNEFSNTEINKTKGLTNFNDEEDKENAPAINDGNQLANEEIDQIIVTEPWLQSSRTWKYLFDWRMENAKGTLELIEVIVNSYWRLRRAEDEGYSRVTTLGTEMALSSAFDKAKRVADENVIDSTQYFGYLSRGLTMQVDKLLLGSSVS